MTKIKSTYKIAKYKNRLPHYGEVTLNIEITKTNQLQIIENYKGKGWIQQGYEENIPEKIYSKWKDGIRNGIKYAFDKLINIQGIKITIVEAKGLITDTNPTILGFVASRAILKELENSESQEELKRLEQLVFSSWNYNFDSIPNFEKNKIIRNKLSISISKNNNSK